MDFSSNGKYLASCADDRTVRIWSTKDFLEREHRCVRANVELDHAVLVRFSPDSRFERFLLLRLLMWWLLDKMPELDMSRVTCDLCPAGRLSPGWPMETRFESSK